jgi:hypothetical protein
MPWTATSTPGTQFKLTVSAVLKLLEGVQSLSGPGGNKPLTAVTAISDVAVKNKTGRPIYGKVSGQVAFDPTDVSQVKLLTAFAAVPSVAVACEVGMTENGGKASTFSALFDEWGLSIPNEGAVMVSFGATITTPLVLATPSSVTPNASFDSAVGQGCTLGLWVTSAYSTIAGASNIEISGCSRSIIPATQLSATTPSYLTGIPDFGSLSFDLLYDSSDANHALLKAAFDAQNQTDRLKITFANAGPNTITLNPVRIVGWEFMTGEKDAANKVKVTAKIDTTITIA